MEEEGRKEDKKSRKEGRGKEGGRKKERQRKKQAKCSPSPLTTVRVLGSLELPVRNPQETSLPSASLCQCRSDQKRKHECFTRMLIHHFGAHPWQIPRVDCVPVMSARSPLVSNGQEPFTQYFCRGCCSKKEKCTAL